MDVFKDFDWQFQSNMHSKRSDIFIIQIIYFKSASKRIKILLLRSRVGQTLSDAMKTRLNGEFNLFNDYMWYILNI